MKKLTLILLKNLFLKRRNILCKNITVVHTDRYKIKKIFLL